MTTNAMRSRYMADGVATASPARLLLMLYDRLARDLVQASSALRASQVEEAAGALQHAQAIVLELRGSLDLSKWPEGEQLASIYGFLAVELIDANVRQDADKVDMCLSLVEPLRLAWQQAASSMELNQVRRAQAS